MSPNPSQQPPPPRPDYRPFFRRVVVPNVTPEIVTMMEQSWRLDPENPEKEFQFFLHRNLSYAVRWAVQRVALPSSVRIRAAEFLKSHPEDAKPFLTVAIALETNNKELLV